MVKRGVKCKGVDLYRATRAQAWEVALMALRCTPALSFRAI